MGKISPSDVQLHSCCKTQLVSIENISIGTVAGYIDVGDGCWWPNKMMTSFWCWCQDDRDVTCNVNWLWTTYFYGLQTWTRTWTWTKSWPRTRTRLRTRACPQTSDTDKLRTRVSAHLQWWHRDVGDNFRILLTKRHVGYIFLHVGDIPISHQHNYMPECDVGDRFVMLETFFKTWWHKINVGANFKIKLVQWT